MTNTEVAAQLREFAQEARTLQQHLRRLLEPGGLQDPATARRLEDALRELERLASTAQALATLAETE